MGAKLVSAPASEERSLDAQESAFFHAQVELAIAPFRATLSDTDLGWMRERMLESLRRDPSLLALARAACPRVADESGEVFRGAADPDDSSPVGPRRR